MAGANKEQYKDFLQGFGLPGENHCTSDNRPCHQVLCSILGFDIKRKVQPMQGSQVEIDLFGKKELVGFYNTFAPVAATPPAGLQVALIPGLNELIALKGSHFTGFQFHPESLLTKNGYTILHDTVAGLL